MTNESLTQEASPKVSSANPLTDKNSAVTPTFNNTTLNCEIKKLVEKAKNNPISVDDINNLSQKIVLHKLKNNNISINIPVKKSTNRIVKNSSMKRKANLKGETPPPTAKNTSNSVDTDPINSIDMETTESPEDKITKQLKSLESTIVELNKVIENLTRQNNQQHQMITSLQNQLQSRSISSEVQNPDTEESLSPPSPPKKLKGSSTDSSIQSITSSGTHTLSEGSVNSPTAKDNKTITFDVRSSKPPPIKVFGQQCQTTVNIVKKLNLDSHFSTKMLKYNKHTITVNNVKDFKTIKSALQAEKVDFCTNTLKEEKEQVFLLKVLKVNENPPIDIKSNLKCVLCNEFGHPASYRGCNKFKAFKDNVKKLQQRQKKEREKKLASINKLINPAVSFRDIMRKNSPNDHQNTYHTQTHQNQIPIHNYNNQHSQVPNPDLSNICLQLKTLADAVSATIDRVDDLYNLLTHTQSNNV
ncbi:hypothetical protein KQX54_012177 [Cotesia glomerata]|uniref:Pre-C2HC domain-containing protein n=1 Tax=Cotesia glomerata TaxID=32391 RepID=A0AAV7HE44_COTGL|nr:hypothetical protein KQX54_012177 [Cotesia glomerata]